MYKEFTFSSFSFIGPISGRRIKKNILKAYPYLKAEDIDEALGYAASLADEETLEFAK